MLMTILGSSASQYAARLQKMKDTEARLMQFARKFGNTDSYRMTLIDTPIPADAIPLKGLKEDLNIHGVRVEAIGEQDTEALLSEYPIVLLHGYMNGALYYYRNLVGLTKHFHTVFSLDLLGWGLSSRPTFTPLNDSVQATEDVFVESLEEWRKSQKIDKMVLAGHSMGGYLSVAYCERYPERVERLILLSPVGVPEDANKNRRASSWTRWAVQQLFHMGATPCSVVRRLPKKQGRGYIERYVEHRLPAVEDPEEREALTDYLYYNVTLPGSGEYALQRLLTPFAFAKDPMVHRIPKLKVSNVSFLYGAVDWMDASGGLEVERNSNQKVSVYQVPNAGHLLMLDNWLDFEAAIVMAAGGVKQQGPTRLAAQACGQEAVGESAKSTLASPPPQVVL